MGAGRLVHGARHRRERSERGGRISCHAQRPPQVHLTAWSARRRLRSDAGHGPSVAAFRALGSAWRNCTWSRRLGQRSLHLLGPYPAGLAASGELRCTPNGFLVTRATVPVSCILWIMAWVDGAWHTIFDKRAAKYPITGTVGGDKDLGLHPDVLANQRCAELDREAAVLEEIGRATSEPPPPRKEGEPSGAGDWYSPYLRRSLHGRRTFGWDFRRRELDRAVFDKPAGWKESVVRHCPPCGEWVPVEATRCQARCKAVFLYGGSPHTLPQPAALALEAPLSKAVAAPSRDAEVAARMLQYKTSCAASYRSEFKRAVRTAVKNCAKFQTYDAQRVLDFTRDGRHWLWNKKGAFNSFEAPSWDTDIPRHAWKDDDELSCFYQYVYEAIFRFDSLGLSQADFGAQGAESGSKPWEEFIDDMMTRMYGSRNPTREQAAKALADKRLVSARTLRGEGGQGQRVQMRAEAVALLAEHAQGTVAEEGEPSEVTVATAPAAAAAGSASSSSGIAPAVSAKAGSKNVAVAERMIEEVVLEASAEQVADIVAAAAAAEAQAPVEDDAASSEDDATFSRRMR